MFAVAEAAAAAEGGINFKLKEGFSAETSGFNLLIMNVLTNTFLTYRWPVGMLK